MVRGLPDYVQEAVRQRQLEAARTAAALRPPSPVAEWEDPSTWGEKFFYLYDRGELIGLFPVQKEAMREAVSLDKNGKFNYTTVLWSWPKKSAKSTIIALMVDWVASHRANSRIRLVANDLRQADSRVGMYLRESIKMGAIRGYPDDIGTQMQDLRKNTKISISGYNIRYPNGSIIEMVPIDPSGEAGGNDDMIVFSELWGWKSKAHQQMWTEMTISPTRFGDAQRWVDTYAGFVGDSPVLHQIYNVVVEDDNRCHAEYEFYSKERTFATWVTVPLLPWQTPEYYAQEEAILEPSEFQRIHRNQWSEGRSPFVPLAWFDSCRRDVLPKIRREEEMIIALDAGTDSDCFAMIMMSKTLEKDPNDDELVAHSVIRDVSVWYPKDYQKFTFELPKKRLKQLCSLYNVVQVCYDPWQLKHFVDELDNEGIAWFEPFQQQSERAIADKMLYDMIRQHKFIHDGTGELRDHIGQADKATDGSKLRIVKRDPKLQIDLVIATSMANKRVMDVISEL